MRLRAIVRRDSQNERHSANDVADEVSKPRGLPSVADWVEISVEEGGVYLFHYDSVGDCFADTWHRTIEEAKEQAEFELNIKPGDWSEVQSAD
jgi:hypothetical protein